MKLSNMFKCRDCQTELLWGGDHMAEDHGLEGDGIVSNYTCQEEDCSVELVMIYTKSSNE